MTDERELQHLKEQLRIKNSEIKRLASDKEKQDEKIQFLQDSTQKRIQALQVQVDEQNDEIEYHKRQKETVTKEDAKPQQEAPKPSAPKAKPQPDDAVQMDRNQKALQILKELKTKNDRLSLRLAHEQEERDRLTKEKGVLAREIRRLQNEPTPQPGDNLKEKVRSLEMQMKQAELRQEELLREKDMIITGYEKAVESVDQNGHASPTTVKKLAEDLQALKKEKVKLEETLEREKKRFETKLSRKLEQMGGEIEQEVKKKLARRAKKSGPPPEAEESTGDWITTYADMATLLMTFFILYFSLGQMNIQKIKDAIERGGLPGELKHIIESQESQTTLEASAGMREERIVKDLEELIMQIQAETGFEMNAGEDRIVLKLPGETLFKPGSAEIDLEKSREALNKIVTVAKIYPAYKIKVQGHTDDSPIRSDRFPTNWELSSARASAVLRVFLDKNISPQRVTASGYADAFPIADNDTDRGRRINRRVEIVLEKQN